MYGHCSLILSDYSMVLLRTKYYLKNITMFNVFVFCLIICELVSALEFDPLSDAFIDHINKMGKWKAGRNFHPDTPMSYIKNLMGVKLQDPGVSSLPTGKHDPELIKALPKNFDPREKWPNCPSLNEIRDQDSCGSCWAFGAAEVMTDRVCIYSNGSKNFHFSTEDLVTCGGDIGNCGGGYDELAWLFWGKEGIVSGGNYESNEGCMPYSLPPCDHTGTGKLPKCTNVVPTPPCVRKCQNGYSVPYKQDKRRGRNIFRYKGENTTKAELFLNGPLEASFEVHADFVNYKSGVYRSLTDHVVGNHAVKVMGWGEEDGVKYWLIANSWNTNFGLKGFFKMQRGIDEGNIESRGMIGGEPILEEY